MYLVAVSSCSSCSVDSVFVFLSVCLSVCSSVLLILSIQVPYYAKLAIFQFSSASSKHFCLVPVIRPCVFSALEILLSMRYINLRFTYLIFAYRIVAYLRYRLEHRVYYPAAASRRGGYSIERRCTSVHVGVCVCVFVCVCVTTLQCCSSTLVNNVIRPTVCVPVSCDVEQSARVNCGCSGTTQDQCSQRNCCWDAATEPNCYRKISLRKYRLPAPSLSLLQIQKSSNLTGQWRIQRREAMRQITPWQPKFFL